MILRDHIVLGAGPMDGSLVVSFCSVHLEHMSFEKKRMVCQASFFQHHFSAANRYCSCWRLKPIGSHSNQKFWSALGTLMPKPLPWKWRLIGNFPFLQRWAGFMFQAQATASHIYAWQWLSLQCLDDERASATGC